MSFEFELSFELEHLTCGDRGQLHIPWLVEVSFAYDSVLAGLRVEIVDVEVGADVEVGVADGEVEGGGAEFLVALDAVEDAVGPDEHGGAFVEGGAGLVDAVGGDDEAFDAAVLLRVQIDIAGAVEDDEVVVLVGVHIPGALDGADGAGGEGAAGVEDVVECVDVGEGFDGDGVEVDAGGAAEDVERDDAVEAGDFFDKLDAGGRGHVLGAPSSPGRLGVL